jgi:putative transposase
MVRILSMVDSCTREGLALEADASLGSGRVTRVLERLIGERGRPENLRLDNGPELTSRRMLSWAEDWKGYSRLPAEFCAYRYWIVPCRR